MKHNTWKVLGYGLLGLMLPLWTSGCLYTESEYLAKVKEAKTAKGLAEERQETIQNLEGTLKTTKEALQQCSEKTQKLEEQSKQSQQSCQLQNETLSKELEQVKQEKTQLEGQLQNTKTELVESKEKVDREKEIHDQLLHELKEELEQGKVKIANNTTVRMEDKLLFDSGKAFIKASGFQILKKIGSVLQKISDKQIQVEGHTDNQPIGGKLKSKFATNWELSTARATTVVRYLIDEAGVSPNRISAAGYGEHHPIANNDSAKGRQENRRVEFSLKPLSAPVP